MNNSPLVIANHVVEPGEHKAIFLPAAALYTHTPMDIPVHIFHGKKAGATLFVTAAIHGDEINGVEIIRRLHKQKALKALKGTLITVPIVNAYGFILQSRYLPDRRDLNRAFPGSKKGSLAARLAHVLLSEIVSKCDFGIDLHTGSLHRSNLPQIRFLRGNSEAERLAKIFNAPVMLPSMTRDGSLRDSATKMGVPILVYEGGEALRFDSAAIRIGIRGILNVLAKLDMINKSFCKATKSKTVRLEGSQWIRAPLSGMCHQLKKLGSVVNKGQNIINIVDPFGGMVEKVHAPLDGIIIGYNQLPLVNQGDALLHLACTEKVNDLADLSEAWIEQQNNPI